MFPLQKEIIPLYPSTQLQLNVPTFFKGRFSLPCPTVAVVILSLKRVTIPTDIQIVHNSHVHLHAHVPLVLVPPRLRVCLAPFTVLTGNPHPLQPTMGSLMSPSQTMAGQTRYA